MDISDDNDSQHQQTDDLQTSESSVINNHKILKDINSLGCTQKSLSAAAYRIYLDLYEVRKYEEVSYHYLKELDLIYLKGIKKKDEKEEEEIIIPVLASKRISFEQIEHFQDAFNSSHVTIAICDSNALVMYYKVTRS